MKKEKVFREEAYFIQAFNKQYKTIVALNKLFDEGSEEISAQIALIIRTFVHDKGSTVSLLSHLNAKNITFFDSTSGGYDPENLLDQNNLVLMEYKHTIDPEKYGLIPQIESNYEPIFHKHVLTEVDFSTWWEGGIISFQSQDALFSRKDIVLTHCDKNGGAHFDKSIDKDYHSLENEKHFAIQVEFIVENTGIHYTVEMPSMIPASIRQISYELCTAIERNEVLSTYIGQ